MRMKNSTLKYIPPLWAMAVAAALFLFMAFQVIVTGGSSVDAPVYGVVSQFISPGLEFSCEAPWSWAFICWKISD